MKTKRVVLAVAAASHVSLTLSLYSSNDERRIQDRPQDLSLQTAKE
jgi:hypothetical protein